MGKGEGRGENKNEDAAELSHHVKSFDRALSKAGAFCSSSTVTLSPAFLSWAGMRAGLTREGPAEPDTAM